jgi:hypothetical protein
MSIDTGKTSSATPPTIVLVHGVWHDGWCWEQLTPLLEHPALPATPW